MVATGTLDSEGVHIFAEVVTGRTPSGLRVFASLPGGDELIKEAGEIDDTSAPPSLFFVQNWFEESPLDAAGSPMNRQLAI